VLWASTRPSAIQCIVPWLCTVHCQVARPNQASHESICLTTLQYLVHPLIIMYQAMATRASYAMGSVLHNRKLDTELRRVVLLAKMRPVGVGVLLHGLACSHQ
jgi:hypothetical protein